MQKNDENNTETDDKNTDLLKNTEKKEQNINVPNDFSQNLSISTCTKMINFLTEIISNNVRNGNIRGTDCQ